MLDDLTIIESALGVGVCYPHIAESWQRIKKLAEAQATSTNSAMPKLPTFEEVDIEVVSELKRFGVRPGRPLHRIAYDFMCRQLSA